MGLWCVMGFRFMKTKNPAALAAFVPLSFILGYQLDMAYGNKIERIAGEFLFICRCTYVCACC